MKRLIIATLAIAAMGAAKAGDADDAAFLEDVREFAETVRQGLKYNGYVEEEESPLDEAVLSPDEAAAFIDKVAETPEVRLEISRRAAPVDVLKREIASGERRLVRQRWRVRHSGDDCETNVIHSLVGRHLVRGDEYCSNMYVFPWLWIASDPDGMHRVDSAYTVSADALLGPHAVATVADEVATTNAVDIEVIADVETVDFDSLVGCAPTWPVEDEAGSSVEMSYRVGLYVRDVQKGTCDLRRIAFKAVKGWGNAWRHGTWLFYRGMTLRVGLTRSPDGSLRVERVEPASPFPPYSTKGISLYDRGEKITSGFRLFSSRKRLTAFNEEAYTGLFVEYPNSTLAAFVATNDVSFGDQRMPNFGEKSQVHVWTDDPAAADAWRNVWFAGLGDTMSVTELKDDWRTRAEDMPDYMPEEDKADFAALYAARNAGRLFAFRWGNVTMPTGIRFSPPATMKDVADFFTVGSRPLLAGIENDPKTYTVRADASAASRIVRPVAIDSPTTAYDALCLVCRMNGCNFTIDGQTVTISAEVPDGELDPPDLDALLAELEAKGFVNVADAKYVNARFKKSTDWSVPRLLGLGGGRPTGTTWVRTLPADDSRLEVIMDGCRWQAILDATRLPYEAIRDKPENYIHCYEDSVPRLDHDIALVEDMLRVNAMCIGRIDSDDFFFGSEMFNDYNDVDCLAFILHIRQTGRREQSDRLARLLFLRPASASAAVKELRKLVENPPKTSEKGEAGDDSGEAN